MAELGDEHGGHAVERGAALLVHGLQRRQRVEAGAGIDHGAAMGDAGEVAQHHAEAVVERHRDADLVVGAETLASPMKKPLFRMLWWVSVAPLGAPVVPLVNWMLIGSSNCSWPASSCRRARWLAVPSAAISANGTVPGVAAADLDHGLQPGQARAVQPAAAVPLQLGGELAQHAPDSRWS